MDKYVTYHGLKFDLDKRSIPPRFDPARFQNHDLLMGRTFHVPKTLVLTTEPPESFTLYVMVNILHR